MRRKREEKLREEQEKERRDARAEERKEWRKAREEYFDEKGEGETEHWSEKHGCVNQTHDVWRNGWWIRVDDNGPHMRNAREAAQNLASSQRQLLNRSATGVGSEEPVFF